jgi:hypothetical protein
LRGAQATPAQQSSSRETNFAARFWDGLGGPRGAFA